MNLRDPVQTKWNLHEKSARTQDWEIVQLEGLTKN